MNQLKLKTKSNQVEEGGVVTVAVAAFGNADSQNDISEKGSFKKTLQENKRRFKHFLNHDQNKLIGCPIDAWEDNHFLVFKSELSLDTEIGRDAYANYKLYQKNGLTLEHSIGVEDVKRDPFDKRKVVEWRLWEFSTLYGWGANEFTPLLDLKQLQFTQNPKRSLDFVRNALKLKFSDQKLQQYESYLNLLEKAIVGDMRMVSCECGLIFDYDSVSEQTLRKEVMEIARNILSWRTHDIVAAEIQQLDNDIQAEVAELLRKGRDLSALTEYVYCPRCGRRIYKSDISNLDQPTTKRAMPLYSTSPQEKSHLLSTLNLKTIGGLLGN